MTSPLVPVKTEPVTYWEIGIVLEHAAKAIKDMAQLSAFSYIKSSEEDAYFFLQETIQNVHNRLATLQKVVAEADEKAADIAEAHYSKMYKLVSDLNNRLGSLPKISESAHVPYNTADLITFAEKVSHLSAKDWERVRQIAELFAREK